MKIKGVDSITASPMPPLFPVELTDEAKDVLMIIQAVCNKLHVAIIPYCINCRVPLDWYLDDSEKLWECPECGREWRK